MPMCADCLVRSLQSCVDVSGLHSYVRWTETDPVVVTVLLQQPCTGACVGQVLVGLVDALTTPGEHGGVQHQTAPRHQAPGVDPRFKRWLDRVRGAHGELFAVQVTAG